MGFDIDKGVLRRLLSTVKSDKKSEEDEDPFKVAVSELFDDESSVEQRMEALKAAITFAGKDE